MNQQTIAVLFGGRAPEHDVSIVSAIGSVIKPLQLSGHQVVPIYIAKNGNWYTGDQLAEIKTYQTGKIDEIIAKQKPLAISVNDGLTIFPEGRERKAIKIDIAFPVMHGSYGEDGSLMGLLRMANVPFVGCDMEASVVAMNKVLAKQVAEANGVPTPKYLAFTKAEFENDRAEVMKQIDSTLRYPLFVKPPHAGSSIGITKVKAEPDLANALEVAAYYDDVILIEESVENLIEVTVPIIGNDQPIVANVERPTHLTDDGVFDFETKYLGGGKKGGKGGKSGKQGAQGYSEIPAKLPEKLYRSCEDVALRIYRAVGLLGIARIDLLIDSKTNIVYFNEINPMPGSLYAHNWVTKGVSNVALVEKLLDYAIDSFTKRAAVNTTFSTNFLKQF
ncbi:D-alanine--D-alanine ligase [Candidatus Saccharibacteria bacterium]|nr:D-alanine--D-alanine ligase [Candidatus Saccharibacteria bacterium]